MRALNDGLLLGLDAEAWLDEGSDGSLPRSRSDVMTHAGMRM